MARWSKHRNLWVRRASIVGLIPLARRGQALDRLYAIARRLHPDDEDLIQKAVGWALREAGKADMARLERYLQGQRSSHSAHDPSLMQLNGFRRRNARRCSRRPVKETDKEREERYRRKPRLEKLGIKPHSRVAAIAIDDEGFLTELKAAVASLSVGRVVKDCDAIFYGVTKEAHLPRLAKLKHSLKSNGAIWVIGRRAAPKSPRPR
jgi:hypothetical protein